MSETSSAPPGSFHSEGDRVTLYLSAVDALQEVGGAIKLTITDQEGLERKIIIMHTDADTYLAFADQCTHNGKELNYLHEDRKLACAGLGSQFGLSGQVIRGPAVEAVYLYHLRIEGDGLVIEL